MSALVGLLSVVLILAAPSLVTLWARRPHRQPLTVVTYLPAPVPPSVDLRTPEQRAADQARFDRALPRVGGAA